MKPKYIIPDRIKYLVPNAKVVLMVREPVNRAYSFYNYLIFLNRTTKSKTFHDCVVEALTFWKSCTKNYTELRCLSGRLFPYGIRRPSDPVFHVYTGIYDVILKEYMRVFQNNLLILKFESYTQNPLEYFEKIVFTHLGLDTFSETAKAKYRKSLEKRGNQPVNYAPHKQEFTNYTRSLLQAFYTPYNQRLIDLLGENFRY